MRIVRFIGLAVILCLGLAGQGGAQKRNSAEKQRDDIRKYGAMLMAWSGTQRAIVRDLVETWEKCEDEINRDDKGMFQCEVYQEKVRQTPIENLVRVGLEIKLPKEDMEQLKRDIVAAAADAYAHGKEKGVAK